MYVAETFLRALCIPAARTLTVLLLSITGRNKVKILPQSMENFAYHHNHNDHDHYSCIPTTRSCNNLLEVAQNYKLLNLPSSGNSIYPIINTSWLLFHMHFVLGIFKRKGFFCQKLKVGIDHKCLFWRFCLIYEHFSQSLTVYTQIKTSDIFCLFFRLWFHLIQQYFLHILTSLKRFFFW